MASWPGKRPIENVLAPHTAPGPTGPYMDIFGYNNFGPFFPSATQPTNSTGNDHFWSKQAIGQSLPGNPYLSVHDEAYYSRDTYGDSFNAGVLEHVETGMGALTLDYIKTDFTGQTVGAPSFQPNNPPSSGITQSNVIPTVLPGAGHSGIGNSFDVGKRLDSINLTSNSVGLGVNQSSSSVVGQSSSKKPSWASVASQPAKPQPKSLKSKISGSTVLTSGMPPPTPPTSIDSILSWYHHYHGHHGQQPPPPPQQPQQQQPPPPPQQQSQHHHGHHGQQQSQQHHHGHHGQQQQQQQNHHHHHHHGHHGSSNAGHHQGSTGASGSGGASGGGSTNNSSIVPMENSGPIYPSQLILEKLRTENNYNPKEFDLSPKDARYFIIKSYSEDDIHRSIKYSIWCSTEHGNKRLDNAFKSQENKGPLYLFYSVNGSGHFCGMAQMLSMVDYSSSSNVWAQDKWKGQFKVKWIYVKDVPNAQLRHIRLENNENKPVTNSRDTQEVPYPKGNAVLKIMHNYRHTTSIFDDFLHYEKRQEEEYQRRVVGDPLPINSSGSGSSSNGHNNNRDMNNTRENTRENARENTRENARENTNPREARETRDRDRDNNTRDNARGVAAGGGGGGIGGNRNSYRDKNRDNNNKDKNSSDHNSTNSSGHASKINNTNNPSSKNPSRFWELED